MKIFITGFAHSGTTMTHQLIKAHPDVGWIENEMSYIEYDKPKEWVLLMAKKRVPDLKKYSWGEKLPWETREGDKDGTRIINISKKWLKFFGKEARILQVLRHPLDVSLSTYPLPTTRNTVAKDQLEFALSSLSNVINFMNSDKRCAVVLYEDLVTKPEVYLHKIFNFLNLKSNEKLVKKVMNTTLTFGKINSERAFAYKNKKIKIKVDYKKIVDRIKHRI